MGILALPHGFFIRVCYRRGAVPMKPLTRPQREALLKIYGRGWGGNPKPRTYLQFRRTAQREICGDAIMVHWCGMWLGIEPDGRTHA